MPTIRKNGVKRGVKDTARQTHAAGAPLLQRSVSDLRALAHPLRLRMMELFAESPKTTKQVATILGEPPTRLYHHVAALERAGLLALKETRPNRGVVEKWYASVAQQFSTREGGAHKSGSTSATRRALAATALEQARQEILAAPSRGTEPPFLARLMVAAPPSLIPRLRERLFDLLNSIRDEAACDTDSAVDDPAHERWSLTIAFAPLPQKRR